MKTIFDVIDELVEKKVEGGKIYRTTFSDNGQMRVALGADSSFSDSNYVGFMAKRAIFISFHEKEPGVISSRKNKSMQMALQLIMRDTYIPQDTITKIEILETEEDIAGVVETVANLRKNIEDAAAGEAEAARKLILAD